LIKIIGLYNDNNAGSLHSGSSVGLFTFLGLVLRAGKLSFGFDESVQLIVSKKAKLVLVTSDLSKNTLKNLCKYTEKCNITVIELPDTMETTLKFLNKRSGIIVIKDRGFANKALRLITKH
jgi:ribosomal protein L7Ae-like RNA K-turn-binding protein